MENTNMSIIPNVELMEKVQIKFKNIGIDVNAIINSILQRIIDEDFTEKELMCLSKKDIFHSNSDNPIETPQQIKEYFDKLPKEEVERRIKFAKTQGPTSESIGIFKGMIWISDDFDEPLEEMKEYM